MIPNRSLLVPALAALLSLSLPDPAAAQQQGTAPEAGSGQAAKPAARTGRDRAAAKGDAKARTNDKSAAKEASKAAPKGAAKGEPKGAPKGAAKSVTRSAAKDAGQAKDAGSAKPAAAPGGGQATLLASYGDWGAYATQGSGKSRICYALAQPKERLPKTLKRDPGYLFVSFRPADHVKNEIAVMMGFPTKDGGEAEAAIGSTTFALITKDQNAWVKDLAEEAQVVAAMAKGQTLLVKAVSRRGNATTDRYSLAGFGHALERVRKECP